MLYCFGVLNEKVYIGTLQINAAACFTRKNELLKVAVSPLSNIFLFAAVKLWYDSADHMKSSHVCNILKVLKQDISEQF